MVACLRVPASFLAWGSSDQRPQHQKVHIGGLMEGRSGSLLSWGDAHSVWLHSLANIVISRGHRRWCPVYVESEQALLNTTEVTGQQCNVSFGWHPTSDLTYVSQEVEVGIPGWAAGMGVVPLRSAQMTGPPPPPHTPQKEFQIRHTFLLSRSVGLACPIEPVARSWCWNFVLCVYYVCFSPGALLSFGTTN